MRDYPRHIYAMLRAGLVATIFLPLIGAIQAPSCAVNRPTYIDFAFSRQLGNCFVRTSANDIQKVVEDIAETYPSSKFSISTYGDHMDHRIYGCFEMLRNNLSPEQFGDQLRTMWPSRICNEEEIRREQTYIDHFGSIERFQSEYTQLAFWNVSAMADSSLTALTYLGNHLENVSPEEAIRIAVVVTPKLPHYWNAPSNGITTSVFNSEWLPAPFTTDGACGGFSYPRFETAAHRLSSRNVIPIVLHTYDDVAINHANTHFGWQLLMSSMGYGGYGNVKAVNSFGDKVAEKLLDAFQEVCAFSGGMAPQPPDKSPSEEGWRVTPMMIVMGAGGVVGLVAVGVLGITRSLQRMKEEEQFEFENVDEDAPQVYIRDDANQSF